MEVALDRAKDATRRTQAAVDAKLTVAKEGVTLIRSEARQGFDRLADKMEALRQRHSELQGKVKRRKESINLETIVLVQGMKAKRGKGIHEIHEGLQRIKGYMDCIQQAKYQSIEELL